MEAALSQRAKKKKVRRAGAVHQAQSREKQQHFVQWNAAARARDSAAAKQADAMRSALFVWRLDIGIVDESVERGRLLRSHRQVEECRAVPIPSNVCDPTFSSPAAVGLGRNGSVLCHGRFSPVRLVPKQSPTAL